MLSDQSKTKTMWLLIINISKRVCRVLNKWIYWCTLACCYLKLTFTGPFICSPSVQPYIWWPVWGDCTISWWITSLDLAWCWLCSWWSTFSVVEALVFQLVKLEKLVFQWRSLCSSWRSWCSSWSLCSSWWSCWFSDALVWWVDLLLLAGMVVCFYQHQDWNHESTCC